MTWINWGSPWLRKPDQQTVAAEISTICSPPQRGLPGLAIGRVTRFGTSKPLSHAQCKWRSHGGSPNTPRHTSMDSSPSCCVLWAPHRCCDEATWCYGTYQLEVTVLQPLQAPTTKKGLEIIKTTYHPRVNQHRRGKKKNTVGRSCSERNHWFSTSWVYPSMKFSPCFNESRKKRSTSGKHNFFFPFPFGDGSELHPFNHSVDISRHWLKSLCYQYSSHRKLTGA